VALGLSVIEINPCSDDFIAQGAQGYTCLTKEIMATANLANTVEQIIDIINF
jgi:hypothetical protein